MFEDLELPVPDHFEPDKVGQVWKVSYMQIASKAREWAKKYDIKPASADSFRVCLLLIDVQNTFCIPDFELFVAGRSGNGAVEDNIRLCKFIYRNLKTITQIVATMDTHTAIQIFHPIFFVDEEGNHPAPATNISVEDVESGRWRINPDIAGVVGDLKELERHLLHYVKKLKYGGKYDLTVWPYHAMLGGIGHALVPAVEEACFFHSIARRTQVRFEIKGDNPLTENYSALKPEVTETADGKVIAQKNTQLTKFLQEFDMLIVAGQAKSHCVAWTVSDLLDELSVHNPDFISKIYLLEDCTSPVVIPNVVDFTELSDKEFKRFSEAGMKIISSTSRLNIQEGK